MTILANFAVPAFTAIRDDAGVFRYVDANAALLTWAGISEDDLIGRTPCDLLGDRTGAQVVACFERCLAERSIVAFEGDVSLPTGVLRPRTTLIPTSGPEAAGTMLLGIVGFDTGEAGIQVDLAVLNRHLDLAIRSLKGADWRYDVGRGRYEASPNLALLIGEKQPRAVPWSEWEARIFPEDLSGCSCATLVDGGAGEQVVTFRFHGQGGETRWARCRRVMATEGVSPVVCGVVTDITDEVAREQQLLEEACTDSLTGLLNRRGLRQHGETLRAKRENAASLTVLMLDLDDFKRINDRLGHAVGDAVLAEVGRRLTTICGPAAAIARLGGDEFAAVVPDLTERDANRLAEDVGAALRQPLRRPEGAVPMNGSVGLCWRPAGGDVHALMAEADDRLYRAKRARKARLAEQDPDRQINLFAA